MEREYIWLGDRLVGLISAQKPGVVLQVHTDHLGTPRAVSEGATVLWRWESDAFGTTAANEDVDADSNALTQPLRFPGQYRDPESGLNYNYFRDYNPATGRYVQSDPIGLAGGINTYGYVGGNPIGRIDPLGLWGLAAGAGGGEYAGIGGEANSGIFWSPDGNSAGAYTTAGTGAGWNFGLGVTLTVFLGEGTDSFSGEANSYSVSIGPVVIGATTDGSGSVTSGTIGIARGIPIGGNKSKVTTRLYCP